MDNSLVGPQTDQLFQKNMSPLKEGIQYFFNKYWWLFLSPYLNLQNLMYNEIINQDMWKRSTDELIWPFVSIWYWCAWQCGSLKNNQTLCKIFKAHIWWLSTALFYFIKLRRKDTGICFLWLGLETKWVVNKQEYMVMSNRLISPCHSD